MTIIKEATILAISIIIILCDNFVQAQGKNKKKPQPDPKPTQITQKVIELIKQMI